jgi:RNA-splicing ligase RtcB
VIRSHSARGIAEEAPGAYKDVDARGRDRPSVRGSRAGLLG